jgi:hypothetical protein
MYANRFLLTRLVFMKHFLLPLFILVGSNSYANSIDWTPSNVCGWIAQANPAVKEVSYRCKKQECRCEVESSVGPKKIWWRAEGNQKVITKVEWRMFLDTPEERTYFGDLSEQALSNWMLVPSFAPINKAITSEKESTWDSETYKVQYRITNAGAGTVVILKKP